MWYLIIQILFIIIGCILAASYNRYSTRKHRGAYFNIDYSLIFLISIIWPIVILALPCIFLYKKYIKEKLNNFINKLSEVWDSLLN